MDDLVQWLRAQLDEDERTARAATPGPWEWRHEYGEPWQPVADGWLDYSGEHISAPGDRATLFGPGMTPHADAVHIARHDPARVLREIDAKRQVITKYTAAVERMEELASLCERLKAEGESTFMAEMDRATAIHRRDVLHEVLQLHALPYADRPGYRDEWRP